MTPLTLGSFLDREQAFNARLNTYYAKIRDAAADNGIRLLTYHLARDRHRQTLALENLPPETVERARRSPFICETPYTPKADHRLPSFPPATVKAEALLADALSRQVRRLSRYRFMLAQTADGDVRAVLAALVHLKERDIDLMQQLQAMHYFDK